MYKLIESALRAFLQAEDEQDGFEKCLTASCPTDDAIWFQITKDMLNLSCPLKKKWFRPLERDLPTLPAGFAVLDVQSKRYLILGMDKFDEEIITTYLVNYFGSLYQGHVIFNWTIEYII